MVGDGWLVGSVGWSVGRPVGWLVVCGAWWVTVGWFGRLVGRSVGWLVGLLFLFVFFQQLVGWSFFFFKWLVGLAVFFLVS